MSDNKHPAVQIAKEIADTAVILAFLGLMAWLIYFGVKSEASSVKNAPTVQHDGTTVKR